MKTLKVSFFGIYNILDSQNSVFFHLLKNLSKKKIEVVSADKADLLIVGPYEAINIKRKILDLILNKINNKKILNYFPNLDIYSFKRSYKPLRIFLSAENIHENLPKYDYSFNHDLGITNLNHFRFPMWKDNIDWSHEGIFRQTSLSSKRFGSFYKLEDLLRPQGNDFVDKKRDFCIFTSHMNEPRNSIYNHFKESFIIDGYGSYFDKEIKNHNYTNIKKKEIMQNYAFNLCPENSLFPGYYTEKIPESYLGKCLPISWVDQNVSVDFNPKAFINLLDYSKNNYQEICNLLKDDYFLKKFTNEPLLLKSINLNNELMFVNQILTNL
jgi:hypothetical protein